MRRLNILLFFSLLTSASYAQFVNNGATVTIQAGATLRVETNFVNNAGGTITNNGTLEVQNDFTNAGTFNSGSTSTVKFIGTTNSNVTPGGATLRNVELAKTAQNVTLQGPLAINGDLTFTNDNNKVILGAHNLTINTGGGVVSSDANEYVVTNGTGQFVKGLDANGTITHEIGDLTNYTPVSSAVTGSAYASATLGARTVDAVHPNKPAEADSHLSRYWVVNASGITTYNNLMTGTYASSGDVVGTASRIKGASYAASNWSFTDAATNGTSTVTGRTTQNSSDFTGMNALNKVDITAYLASPLSGSSMTNILQEYDPPAIPTLLPTVSPYGAPTTTYAAIGNPAGAAGPVADWVKVEVRDASNPATILETRSLLLKTNGHIVDATGSIPFFKDQTSNVRYAVHHRNHLAILSNSTTGTFEGKNETYDFSTAQSQAVKLDSGDPDQLQLKNGLFCMRPGDIDGTLEVDGSDLILVRTQFLNGTGSVYINQDVNLDGEVDGSDLILTRVSFLSALFSTIANL